LFKSKLHCLTVCIILLLSRPTHAQEGGTVTGLVTLEGQPIGNALVLVVGTSFQTESDATGNYEIHNIPPGTYEIFAQRDHLTGERLVLSIQAGDSVTTDLPVQLSAVHEDVTVTATPSGAVAAYDAFNAVTVLDNFELIANPQTTLGEVLQNEPGVAKRSFGPGSSRPIIRGFDGDRVLIMEDGIRTGDLSSSSGDHGVLTDPNGLDRVELVRGPATLLYGSNAVGGVVNAITPHESFRQTRGDNTRGQFSIDTGSADQQFGSNAGLQHRQGNLLLWGSGGSRRTGDYNTPSGKIENSGTQISTGRAGIGYLGDKLFATSGFTIEDGRYGVPFAGEYHEHDHAEGHDDHDDHDEEEDELYVDLDSRRRVGRFDVGMANLDNRLIEGFQISFNTTDWRHDELENEGGVDSIHTSFLNRSYVTRAEFTQRSTGRLSGKFGAWALRRNFSATGAEALAPPTSQTAIAAFAYEELDFGRVRVQFGGRLEGNDYNVGERTGHDEEDDHDDHDDHDDDDDHDDHDDHDDDDDHDEEHEPEAPAVRNRNFAGNSVSAGILTNLGSNTTFVTNLTGSHRAPSLSELYNFGPHVGSLTFEVGDSELNSETTIGLDVSLRHQSPNVRGSFNAYVYDIDNFVFSSITDEMAHGLRIGTIQQADSRFLGFDAEASGRIGNRAWLNAGFGAVDAELKNSGEGLPRIPPLRGRISLDLPYKDLTVSPEIIVAAAQNQIYKSETVTSGYSVLNLRLSYVWTQPTAAHVIGLSAYNLTNELYRNHTSFIKDLAPEIGRGVRASYSIRFF
tara:strand:+ start:2878 stop:5259 length:2382 start_codon:yes stop_codon:yes gene_type:complete